MYLVACGKFLKVQIRNFFVSGRRVNLDRRNFSFQHWPLSQCYGSQRNAKTNRRLGWGQNQLNSNFNSTSFERRYNLKWFNHILSHSEINLNLKNNHFRRSTACQDWWKENQGIKSVVARLFFSRFLQKRSRASKVASHQSRMSRSWDKNVFKNIEKWDISLKTKKWN